MVVNKDRRRVGRVPVGVARELVGTSAAKVIHNKPAILELTPNRRGNACVASKATKTARTAKVAKPAKPAAPPKVNAIKNLLDIAGRFTGKRNSRIDILKKVLLRIYHGELCVEATDLEAHFQGRAAPGDKYSLSHDEGVDSVCVDHDRLKKLLPLAAITNATSRIHIRKKEDAIGLEVGEFYLEGEGAENFPVTHTGNNIAYTVPTIGGILDFVGVARSKNAEYHYRGIHFDMKGGCLVATDMNRLHFAPMMEGVEQRGISAIVPPAVLNITKYLSGDIWFVMDKDGNPASTMFELNIPGCTGCYAKYANIEGRYPNYADIVPTNYKNKFTARIEDFAVIVKKALASYSKDGIRHARFHFGDETRVETLGYSAAIKGSYEGTPLAIWVSADYLSDYLRALPPGEIEIHLPDDSNSALLLKGPRGFTSVIMPADGSI